MVELEELLKVTGGGENSTVRLSPIRWHCEEAICVPATCLRVEVDIGEVWDDA
jgi:hypothetical protein